MNPRQQCINAAAAHFDGGHYFAELQRRIAQRTESDTGQTTPALTDYLTQHIAPALGPAITTPDS